MTITSIKLTEGLRIRISNSLMKDRFSANKATVVARVKRLAQACYEYRYDEAMRRKMNRLPTGWLFETCDMHVKFGSGEDSYCSVRFDGETWADMLPDKRRSAKAMAREVTRRIPYQHVGGDRTIQLPREHSLTEEYDSIRLERQGIITAIENLEKEIASVLWSVTTTGKLIETWPEIEPVIRALAPVESAKVPMLVTKELSEKLGLKKAA